MSDHSRIHVSIESKAISYYYHNDTFTTLILLDPPYPTHLAYSYFHLPIFVKLMTSSVCVMLQTPFNTGHAMHFSV